MELLEDVLNNIYSQFKILNNQINNKQISIKNLDEISESIDKYDKQLTNIYTIINSIENIKNQIKVLYSNKIINIKKEIIERSNKNTDNNYSIELVNITNNKKYKHKKYCKMPIIIVSEQCLDTIINTPIYLIKETNEYCIKINNKLIKGNIGNIVNQNKNEKIRKCNRVHCNQKFFKKTNCKFYHENIDIRNFPTYSWQYNITNKLGKIKSKNNSINVNNYDLENTRFIGSLDSLNEDLILTNIYEKKLRNKQLMHDILLYQILDKYLE